MGMSIAKYLLKKICETFGCLLQKVSYNIYSSSHYQIVQYLYIQHPNTLLLFRNNDVFTSYELIWSNIFIQTPPGIALELRFFPLISTSVLSQTFKSVNLRSRFDVIPCNDINAVLQIYILTTWSSIL